MTLGGPYRIYSVILTILVIASLVVVGLAIIGNYYHPQHYDVYDKNTTSQMTDPNPELIDAIHNHPYILGLGIFVVWIVLTILDWKRLDDSRLKIIKKK